MFLSGALAAGVDPLGSIPTPSEPLPISKPISRHSPAVLVVDDRESTQRLLRQFLTARSYRVRTAPSVDEAIDVLEQDTISAVILEVRLPEHSGLELLRFIRSNETLRNLPVLVLTATILTPEEEAVIAEHCAYLFYKPESLEALGACLDQLIGR